MRAGAALALVCLAVPALLMAGTRAEKTAGLPGGQYLPFYPEGVSKPAEPSKRAPTRVAPFRMDRTPVTRAEFLEFVRANPAWRKSRVKGLFADSHYLQDWRSDLAFAQDSKAPVTFVSWFAARAYCRYQGEELPTTDQWEYAAADEGRRAAETSERILAWYSKPNARRLPPVGRSSPNGFGLHDLHGLVWEWTLDFNGAMPVDDPDLFCGNGSQGALDPEDYATFMRYSFRSSLNARYAVGNLGFRCAQGENP